MCDHLWTFENLLERCCESMGASNCSLRQWLALSFNAWSWESAILCYSACKIHALIWFGLDPRLGASRQKANWHHLTKFTKREVHCHKAPVYELHNRNLLPTRPVWKRCISGGQAVHWVCFERLLECKTHFEPLSIDFHCHLPRLLRSPFTLHRAICVDNSSPRFRLHVEVFRVLPWYYSGIHLSCR